MRFTASILILVSTLSHATEKPVHVHGSGNLEIIFEGNTGKISLRAPQNNIVGFENDPKNEAEKKKLEDAYTNIESTLTQMIQFDTELDCHITKEKSEVEREIKSKHADVVMEFSASCLSTLKGTKVKLDFSKLKKIKTLEVKVSADGVNKYLKLNGNVKIVDVSQKEEI